MKTLLFVLAVLAGPSVAFAADSPQSTITIPAQSSFVWAKLMSSMNTTSSKPGDPVTALVMGPDPAWLGAMLEGTVDLADHAALGFSFHTLKLNGKTYRVQSRLISVVNSKGIAGQDDLGQRVDENAHMTAYGITTALNEGAEIHLSVWAAPAKDSGKKG